MIWVARTVQLPQLTRGVHLVTRPILEAVPEIARLSAGLLHVQILHTSAGLTLNENASPDVGVDLESWLDRLAPENAEYWTHTLEGSDDMPAHAKAALVGFAVDVPIAEGRPVLGTWQGVHLCEFRNNGGPRSLSLTLSGEEMDG